MSENDQGEGMVQGMSQSAADVLSGRASPSILSDPAPEIGKASATDDGKAGALTPDPNAAPAVASPEQGKKDGESTDVKPEDLEARLFGQDTPEKTIEKLKRDYSASSREAQRRKLREDKLATMLAEQGLELIEEDGVPVSLAPGKGYSKDGANFKLDFKGLPDDVKALAEEDPQRLVDHIVRAATKALVRAAPTVEKAIRPISDERRDVAVKAVEAMKELDGEVSHPELKKNMPIIERFLKEKPVVRDLLNQDPEFAYALLNDYIERVKERLRGFSIRELTRAQKKKEAEATPGFGPSSGRVATAGAGSSYAESMGKAIAAAR